MKPLSKSEFSEVPRLSVIVPVHNDRERLKSLLEALEQQTLDPSLWEVLVVDNNSTDHPQQLQATFPFVTFLSESEPGSYAARNAALEVARGEVFAFTDSDCLPKPNWLERALSELEAEGAPDAIAGHIEVFPANKNKPSDAEHYECFFAFPQHEYASLKHYGATANMITWAAWFERVGPFNRTLKSGGDQEWGQRLTAAGARVAYARSVVVCHPARTWPQMQVKIRRVAEGKVRRLSAKRYVHLTLFLRLLWLCLPFQRLLNCLRCKASVGVKLRLMKFTVKRSWFEARVLAAQWLKGFKAVQRSRGTT
jgi:glycosyltransferase involved in cell wall biosynthesis